MMKTALLSILAASVLCTVFSRVQRQYHLAYDLKNMTEALKYCREQYTDLATIENMEDVKAVNDLVLLRRIHLSGPLWIGLYDDINSWRWSLTDGKFYKDGEREYRNWYPGNPKNKGGVEHCVQTGSLGQWSTTTCKKENLAVCFHARGQNKKLILINTTMTWTVAQNHCRRYYTDLASVRNEAENNQITNLISKGQRVWIGLFRDTWKWSDGSSSSFRFWANNQPNNHYKNETCVSADLNDSGKWADVKCNQERAFVCHKVLPSTMQKIRVRLVRKDSSLDLNHPVVMEELLKQLEQRMKDEGMTEDIKLSWMKQSDGKVFHKAGEETTKEKYAYKNDELKC